MKKVINELFRAFNERLSFPFGFKHFRIYNSALVLLRRRTINILRFNGHNRAKVLNMSSLNTCSGVYTWWVKLDVQEYIKNQRSSFSQETKSILDYSVFDFNHVPDKPLVRAEAKRIINSLIRYEKTGIPTNQVIFGSRGCGKTLTLKYLSRLMENDATLNILYANVRYYSTSFKILAHILNRSSRGSSLSELYARFRDAYPSRTVIIP